MAVPTYQISAEALSIATLEIVNGIVAHLIKRELISKDEFGELLRAGAKSQEAIGALSNENEEAAKLLDQLARAEAGLWLQSVAVLRRPS